MISAGINAGGDDLPADFYSAHRQSSLYNRHRKITRVSYGGDGRRFVDGHPVTESTADELWKRLMLAVITERSEQQMIYMTTDRGEILA